MMNVETALLQRKSVRAFLDKPVDKSVVAHILSCASHAPSGKNTQPWQVAVTMGQTKELICQQLLNEFTQDNPKTLDYKYYSDSLTHEFKRRAVECGMLLYQTLDIDRNNKEQRLKQWARNYHGFDAPVMLYFFADPSVEKGSFLDYGMFLQSIMLMATSMGLATCPQASLAEYPHIVKQILGYPQDLILLCGISLGYEDINDKVNSYKTPRAPVSEFAKFFD